MRTRTGVTSEQAQLTNEIINQLRAHAWNVRYETIIHEPERVPGGLPYEPRKMYHYLQVHQHHYKASFYSAAIRDMLKHHLICKRCEYVYQPQLVKPTDASVHCTSGRCVFREVMKDTIAMYRKHREGYRLNSVWGANHEKVGVMLYEALI